MGTTVWKKTISETHEFNLSLEHFSQGIYAIILISGEAVSSQRLVIE
jgi:hypothetical protein